MNVGWGNSTIDENGILVDRQDILDVME